MFWRSQLPIPVLAAGFGLALFVGIFSGPPAHRFGLADSLDHWTADWRTSLLSSAVSEAHPDVSIVLIDDETLDRYGTETRLPTNRLLIAELVSTICASGPKVIALDFIFDVKTGNDAALLAAIRSASCPLVLGAAAPPIRQTAQQMEFQARFLKEAGRPYGYLNIGTDYDGVVRTQGETDEASISLSFAEATIATAGRDVHHERFRHISWFNTSIGVEPFAMIPGYVLLPGPTEHESLRKIQNDRLKNRIVILATDLNNVDRHQTPISKLSGEPMLGAVVQAHLIAQILDGRSMRELPPYAKQILAALLAFGGVIVAFKGLRATVFRVSLPICLYLMADAIAFTQLRLTLPFAIWAIAWGIGLFVGRSLDVVYCRNWLSASKRQGK